MQSHFTSNIFMQTKYKNVASARQVKKTIPYIKISKMSKMQSTSVNYYKISQMSKIKMSNIFL